MSHKKELTKANQTTINTQFFQACFDGDLAMVKYLLSSSELKFRAKVGTGYGQGMKYACQNGHLEIAKYLLTAPEAKQDMRQYLLMRGSLENILVNSCSEGHLEIVKLLQIHMTMSSNALATALDYCKLAPEPMVIVRQLVETPKSKDAQYMEGIQTFFRFSCQEGNLAMVKYLLEGEFYDLGEDHQQGLSRACQFGKIEIVEYLTQPHWLSNDEGLDKPFIISCTQGFEQIARYLLQANHLKNKIDVHTQGDIALKNAYVNKRQPLLDFLIYEHDIELTPAIHSFMQENIRKDLLEMFKRRELEKKLDAQLTPAKEKIPRKKI